MPVADDNVIDSSIKKRIYLYMIALTAGCGVVVLIASIALYRNQLDKALREKIEVAAMVADHEIIGRKSAARMAALAMANDPGLIRAVESRDRNRILSVATTLQTMAQVDYCTILESDGTVLARTHEPEKYGDSLAHLPHIKEAAEGRREAYVAQGITVLLGAYAGAPMYRRDTNITGIVSLGFKLDNPTFIAGLKQMTGCEIGIFLNDERIASTMMNADGSFALGRKASGQTRDLLMAKKPQVVKADLLGKDALINFAPIYGANDEIAAMMTIGYFTAEDTNKAWFFMLSGTSITLGILGVCILLARFIARAVERRLENMMHKIRRVDEYTQVLLDAAPLCCILFDSNYNCIGCNQEAVDTYKLKNKQEYLENFFQLSPEFQPDGRRSDEFSLAYIKEAAKDGFVVFDWVHQMLDGTPLPGEVTLVRVNLGDDFVIAGFTRDLREQHAAMSKVQEANKRMLLMLDTSPLCAQIWGRNLETIDCNEAAVKLYGFKNKQEYIDKFLTNCSPERQPDGGLSSEKAVLFVNKAFEEGQCSFEWMHKMPFDDTPIPAEVTLVRAKYLDDEVIIGYTRDMRAHIAAMAEIEKLDKTMALSEYESMKFRLTTDALNVALWDMDIISADPVNPINHIKYSQEFRHLVGFNDAHEFPDVLSSWSDRLHIEDKERSVGAFEAHMNDYTGKTPFDIEYRLLLKNGTYRWFRAFGDTLRDKGGVPLRVAGALMDIEDEKQAKNQLNMMSSIVQNSPNFISFKKLNGECLYINPAATDLTGYGHDDLMKDDLGLLYGPEKAHSILETIAEGLLENGFVQYEHAVKINSGANRIYAGSSFLVDHDSYATIATDVTKVRKNEKERLEAVEMIEYRDKLLYAANNAAALLLEVTTASFEETLLRSMEIIAEAVDVHRICIWKNYEQEGRPHCVLIEEWVSKLRPPASEYPTDVSYDDVLHGWHEKLSTGHILANQVAKMSPDEQAQLSPQHIKSLLVTPVFAKDVFWGYVGFDDCFKARDFSENETMILCSTGRLLGNAFFRYEMLMQLEAIMEAEHKANERLDVMLDALPLICNLWTQEYAVFDCNEEALRLFGLDRKTYLEKFFELAPEYQPDGQPTAEKAKTMLEKAFAEGRVVFEWMSQNLDGTLIPMELSLTRVEYKGGYIAVGYGRDLREHKRLEAEIKEALNIAQDASRAKSEFLSHISHEIRTPMNAILGTAEIQLQKESIQPDIEQAFNIIYNSGNLLLNIINDILDISKIEAGRLELVNSKYDIPSLIYDTMQINMLRYESKPIEFELKVDENTPLNLIGDELRIKQVLNNLLSNAFKYTNKGKVEFEVSAENLSKTKKHCTLIFRIRDTGQGMSQDQIDKLFDAYSRFNVEANRAIAGTGLGMTITKQLLDLMDGEIEVKSKPGEGTLFTVRLPQKLGGTAVCGTEIVGSLRKPNIQNMPKAKRLQIIHEYMPYGKVLIVDDVESNLYVAKGMMLPYGLRIETVKSGVLAVEKIKNGRVYDIIFMDHMMPVMDGMEAAKIIRSMGYNKPIVALTANAVAGQAEMFLANGFDGFISKPIDSRELNSTLNQLIRNKYPADVVEAARRKKGVQKTTATVAAANQKAYKKELVAAFAEDALRALETLNGLMPEIQAGDGDIELFTTTVHGMKSSLANIGETKLSSFAFQLEKAGGGEDLEAIIASAPEFIKELQTLVGSIHTDEPKDGPKASPSDIASLCEKLGEVMTACKKFDMSTAKSAIAPLKEKTWPPDIANTINAIAMDLLRGNLKKAASEAETAISVAKDKI
jgi:PAS domain S-box-containing protein